MLDEFCISLEGDMIFQKFVAKVVVRQQELLVTLPSGKTVTGYLTGLDDMWIQMTTTNSLRQTVLSLDSLESVQVTGRNLGSVEDSKRKKIEGFSYALRMSCLEELKRVSEE